MGRKFRLWRAVDQEGIVLEEILQSKRAKRLLKALIKRFGLPKRIVTASFRRFKVVSKSSLGTGFGRNSCADSLMPQPAFAG
uniref:hypothetical protein n=1 Tax=Paracoccus onchidii TaxID=3017813 RepID=UPI0038CD7A08